MSIQLRTKIISILLLFLLIVSIFLGWFLYFKKEIANLVAYNHVPILLFGKGNIQVDSQKDYISESNNANKRLDIIAGNSENVLVSAEKNNDKFNFENRSGLQGNFSLTEAIKPANLKVKIVYDNDRQKLRFVAPSARININGKNLTSKEVVLHETDRIDRNTIVGINGKVFVLSAYKNDVSLYYNQLSNLVIEKYKRLGQNLLAGQNESFESGPWAPIAGDCSNKEPGEASISLDVSDDATNGKQSIELKSSNHAACTNKNFKIELDKNKNYILSFDYKTIKDLKAGYYFSIVNDGGYESNSEVISSNSHGWQSFARAFSTNLENVNLFNIHFYANSNGKVETDNLYDNLSIQEIAQDGEISLSDFVRGNTFLNLGIDVPILNGDNIMSADTESINLLADENASFEYGGWTRSAEDCSNTKPGEPKLSMKISSDSTDGEKSIELSSQNHAACTYKIFPIEMDSSISYKLSFDYKNISGNQAAYYYNLTNDAGAAESNSSAIDVKDNEWHHHETIIDTKLENIKTIDVHFYASSDGSKEVTNLYDNIKLIPVAPKDMENYYLYKKYNFDQDATPTIENKSMGDFRISAKIKNVSHSFLILMPDIKYSNDWAMFPKINLDQHYMINNYGNAWWIDVDDLCKSKNLCQKNPDGTYDISLIIENNWNKILQVVLLVSTISFIGGAGYLVYSRVKRNRRRELIESE